MRGKVIGFECVDYIRKDGVHAQGVRLIVTCKSRKVFGLMAKEEYISSSSPFYGVVSPYLANGVDDLLGSEIYIDYLTEERGGRTFTDIVDFEITPSASEPETKSKSKAV